MSQPTITIFGNVATKPEHTATKRGTPVTKFRVAQTQRRFNREANRWEDGDTSWYAITCWREWSENVSESFQTGDPVLVVGRLKIREWMSDDGQQRRQAEIDAISVGHDLRRGLSKFTKVKRERAETVADDSEVVELHEQAAAAASSLGWHEAGADATNPAATSVGEATTSVSEARSSDKAA